MINVKYLSTKRDVQLLVAAADVSGLNESSRSKIISIFHDLSSPVQRIGSTNSRTVIRVQTIQQNTVNFRILNKTKSNVIDIDQDF